MEHFRVFSLKAQLLCLILILPQPPINGNKVEGPLPDMPKILEMMQAFISPYLRSFNNSSEPKFRAVKETSVEKAIRKKIVELKPFLQDHDVNQTENDEEDNIALESEDETTIIEFVTSEKSHNKNNLQNQKKINARTALLKDKIDKFKDLRHKIKAALRKEQVSKSTQTLVTNTLDGMMTRLIENRCSWRRSNDKYSNITQKRADKTFSLASEWNKRWDDLKNHFLKYENSNRNTSIPGAELYLFFERFHEFFTHIVKDLKKFSEYKITCQFTKKNSIDENNGNKLDLRQGLTTKKVKRYKCKHFTICSKELSKFMSKFYFMLNDTAISTLKNFALMYIRDTDDSEEKESVVTAVNNVSDIAEHKTSKAFIKETAKFVLNDNKDENANIKALRNYIKNAIEKTKTNIKDILETGLESLTPRLLETVKTDLSVNLDVDLNNLERDFKSRICTVFSICNGQYAGRRSGDDSLNRNSVYVKVQFSLDDELKESIARPRSRGFDDKPPVPENEKKRLMKKTYTVTKINRKSIQKDFNEYTKVNITRTTKFSSSTITINKRDKISTSAVVTKKDNSFKTNLVK